MSLKAQAEALGRTELEIKSEMAAALGRIGSTLAQLIADLLRIRDEIRVLPEPERLLRIESYNQIYSRAKQYYWYLIVQREAIGITNHHSLRELYPLPERDLS